MLTAFERERCRDDASDVNLRHIYKGDVKAARPARGFVRIELVSGENVSPHRAVDRITVERRLERACRRVDHLAQTLRIARDNLVTKRSSLADRDGRVSRGSCATALRDELALDVVESRLT